MVSTSRHEGQRTALWLAPLMLTLGCGYEGTSVSLYVDATSALGATDELVAEGFADSDPSSFEDGLFLYGRWTLDAPEEQTVELVLDLAAPPEQRVDETLSAAGQELVATVRLRDADGAELSEQTIAGAEAGLTHDQLADGLRHTAGWFHLPGVEGDLYSELDGVWDDDGGDWTVSDDGGADPEPEPDDDPCGSSSCSTTTSGGVSSGSSGGCGSGTASVPASSGCSTSSSGSSGCGSSSTGSGCSSGSGSGCASSGSSGCAGDTGSSGCSSGAGSGCSGDGFSSLGSGCGSAASGCAGGAQPEEELALSDTPAGSDAATLIARVGEPGGGWRVGADKRACECRPPPRRRADLFLLLAPFVLIGVRLQRSAFVRQR